MLSLTGLRSSHFEIRERQINARGKCGDVFISPDLELLTLHCIFCDFENNRLDTFLNHLRSEHLKMFKPDISWLNSVKEEEIETEVKGGMIAQIKESGAAFFETDVDPLMAENIPEKREKCLMKQLQNYESNDELSLNSLVDEDTKHCTSDKNRLTLSFLPSERPKDIHIFQLIEYFHEHPTLWKSQLRNRYIRTERQKAYKSIAEKMKQQFPSIKIDYQYILVKISKLKKLYFNYDESNPKISKNEKKFYKKLHFLKGHPPNNEKKKCLLCHKEVFDLPRHVKNHHDENEKFQTCKVCTEVQPSERLLKMHLRSVHRRYECEYCDVVYVALNSLNNHIRKKHSDKPQPPKHPLAKLPSERMCEYCGRQFGSKQVLNRHKRFVHLQQRPYACIECPKTYKAKDKLQSHVNSAHLNVRPHVCETCSRGFYDKKTLKQHIRTHNKDKSLDQKV